MVSVYQIWFADGYQEFSCTDSNQFLAARRKTWRFDGMPIQDPFEELELYVRQPTLKKPDIWQLVNTMAFEDDAAAKVQLSLDQAGEQFNLSFEKRKLVVLNVTHCIDCLDKTQTEWGDPELPQSIEKYAFRLDRLDYSLFKIPETRHGEILTVEGLASPNEEFKPLVEKYGLTGLRFEKIWSSE